MAKHLTWFSENLLNFKIVIVCALVLTVVLGLQKVVAVAVRGSVITWEGTCTFDGWDKDKDQLGLVVSCDGKGTAVFRNSAFVRSYVVNPGPLYCRLDLDDDLECDNRPDK